MKLYRYRMKLFRGMFPVELPAGTISPPPFIQGTIKINRETPRAENVELFEQHILITEILN